MTKKTENVSEPGQRIPYRARCECGWVGEWIVANFAGAVRAKNDGTRHTAKAHGHLPKTSVEQRDPLL